MGRLRKDRQSHNKSHRASNSTNRSTGGGGGRNVGTSCFCYSPTCASHCGGSCTWPAPAGAYTADECHNNCSGMSWTGMCMDFSISGCADWGTECAQSPPWIWEGQIGAGGYGGPHVSCPPGQVWSDVNGCHSPFIGGDPDPQTDLLGYVYFTTNYETGQQVCMSGNQECAWDFSTSTHTAWDAQSCCIQQGMSQTNYTLEYDQCELMGYPDYHVCFYTSVNPVRSIRPIR